MGLAATSTITINVTDINDTAPVFTSTATPSVEEGVKAVVTLASTDADTVGGPTTYSITGGADAAKFEIVSGQLRFINAPDYETQAHSYAIQVTANDGANNKTVQNLTVSVTDVNEAPTTVNVTNTVAEDVAVGATLATVVGTDPGHGRRQRRGQHLREPDLHHQVR
jgi:hypothetical protein